MINFGMAYSVIINFCLLLSSCIQRAEPEIHLIHKDYKGPVVIIFNDPKGSPVKYEGKSRVYEIPENGILRTKFKRQDAFIAPEDLKYYYWAKETGKEELVYLKSTLNITDTSDYVFGKESSNSTVRYLVGKVKDGDNYYQALRRLITELFPPVVQ